jgi:queuine tRNA-ribosyltransferase
VLLTTHGRLETPAFMPVGTYGTVKAMTPEELEDLGTQILLGNTFHLLLRPGPRVIAAHGGLHRFMHWRRPILTDSGGFQVFSLKSLRRISEEGVRFRSPIDGSEVRLTPEDSMDMQLTLRSDIAMALDDCTEHPATEPQARASMERSMRWAERSHRHYYAAEPPGGLFGIVQGGMHANLRLASLEALLRLDWPGWPSAAWRSGNPRRSAWGSWKPSCRTCRSRAPVTSWGSGARRTSSPRCCAASTCSTASCLRATPATGTFSPQPA